MSAFKLTRAERKAVFAGTLKTLRRPEKPDQEPGSAVVVSKTRGGKQVIDRDTGKTIDMPSLPRLWIVVKGWHLRAGSTEWETEITIHDRREQNRVLANGAGGHPQEAGLKTRWGQTVDAEGKVRPKRVPTKDEQHESWTPETERGYGGRNGMERSAEGDLVPASAVDDETLRRFREQVEEENQLLQNQRRMEEETMRREMEHAEEQRKGNRTGASAAKRRAERARRREQAVAA